MDDIKTDRRDLLRAVADCRLRARCRRSQPAAKPRGQVTQPKPATLPNIVFIMADDLGYADLSCYGRRITPRPGPTRWQPEGFGSRRATPTAASARATRTALATGRYQYRRRSRAPGTNQRRESSVYVAAGHRRLASLLRGQGYRTALVGKWHIGASAAASPNNFGWPSLLRLQRRCTSYYPLPAGDPRPDQILRNGDPAEWNGYLTDVLGDEAVRWISAGEVKPFFLSLHPSAAHSPGPRRAT